MLNFLFYFFLLPFRLINFLFWTAEIFTRCSGGDRKKKKKLKHLFVSVFKYLRRKLSIIQRFNFFFFLSTRSGPIYGPNRLIGSPCETCQKKKKHKKTKKTKQNTPLKKEKKAKQIDKKCNYDGLIKIP